MSITVEQVIATLEEVVAEKGEDYVYKRIPAIICAYADEKGEPSCIVGHVVNQIDPEKFAEFRGYENSNGSSFGITETIGGTEQEEIPQLDGWDTDAINALSSAQLHQDAGDTWGEALTAAKATL